MLGMPTKRVRDTIPSSDVEGAESNKKDAAKVKQKRNKSENGKASSGAAESNNGDATKERPKRSRADKGKSSSDAAQPKDGDVAKEKQVEGAGSNNKGAAKVKQKKNRSENGKTSSGAAESINGDAAKEKPKRSRSDKRKSSSDATELTDAEPKDGDVSKEKQKRSRADKGKNSSGPTESLNGDVKEKKKKNKSENGKCSSGAESKNGDVAKVCSRKMPKRAAACSDFVEKSVKLSDKSELIETKRNMTVEHETVALGMTVSPGHDDVPRPNRRLKDFIFHDSDGNPLGVEMLEVNDLFISGIILSLEQSSDEKMETGIECEGFGRIESWDISGYEEGTPVIWISTEAADYDCVKPSARYKRQFNLFYEKARACIEVYKKLSKAHGGNPNLTVDELIAGVVRSMSSSKNFPHGTSIKDFIISHGEFIYNQLAGMDASPTSDQTFVDLQVLIALRDESKNFGHAETIPSGKMNASLKIEEGANHSSPTTFAADEDENMKAARLLQEEDQWLEINKKKREYSSHSSNIYIKINEDEIANDYPLPAYYKTSVEEIDEFLVIEDDGSHKLPENTLNNWTLYNSDARLISLELLPMKPCADIDVTIFGSGLLSEGGNEFCFDFDSNQPISSSSGSQNSSGLPIYLSAIKEWMIEFGSSMIFVSIRTDTSWYRLGKPSKQYAPWFEPVLKTARLAIGIITLLKDQARVSRLSFADVIKRISEFDKNHPAFISSNSAEVERYVVVHGQIILQQISEYPDKAIKNCPFISGLRDKMQLKHHTKWRVNKKAVMKKGENLNPRAVVTIVSKRKAMPATTTKFINRIWGEYYSNYLPDVKDDNPDMKEDDEVEEANENEEEDLEEVEEQSKLIDEEVEKSQPVSKMEKSPCSKRDVKWDGTFLSKLCSGEVLYKQAIVHGSKVVVGDFVLLEEVSDGSSIYCIEYMFESSDARKMAHGRLLLHGKQTVLGNASDEREVFLTNDCLEFELDDVKQTAVVEIKLLPWGNQHRKTNALKDKSDREKAEERKSKGLPMEYYCKNLYWPEKGAFFCLPKDTMGRGNGHCDSCRVKESEKEKESFKLDLSNDGFTYLGIEYSINDFLYLAPDYFAINGNGSETFKSGRNVGLRPYAVCQLLEIESNKSKKQTLPESTMVKIRRFFRPEDISPEKAYCTDIREVYYSQEVTTVPVVAIEGKCEVRRKHDIPSLDGPAIFEHIFFCEHLYDADKGTVKHLPANTKLNFSKRIPDDAAYRKKGKCKEGENDSDSIKQNSDVSVGRLATLDIFAGCGGLSEGFEKAGVSSSKWAIEYEEPAAEAFKLNHPEALVFPTNCNVILRAIMSACGDADDCISTTEASELAEKLDEKVINSLPRPGEVEFICGGPPCQGFSGMNRFNQGNWSKVQCEMILAFLSFADYFRPKYFLLENVRNFVSFNKGQTFRLTLASLLQMGYQVRFGILEAGTFGVSQSRKRAFIWAASPEVTLPEWPEPMHVFAGSELKVTLSGNSQYAAARSTADGAPFRAMTVRDSIGDLPAVGNGASVTNMEYKDEPVSWFQKTIRGDFRVLTDHISKEMNELNVIRCKRIPKRPGTDWRDLPDEKVRLSNGQMVDLVPWCLPNTAKRHNQWKGLFGRLDWEGNFPTSVTDPQPMGKVGMCFHPEQDRIITVRECARSQGFRDSYKFAGNIQHKHRQIGNAVPPPLAYALGRKLKEAMQVKKKSS